MIPWPCLFGLYWTRMRNEQRCWEKIQGHVLIYDLRKSKRKVTMFKNKMEGYAKKWVERYCELANKTTQQLCKVANPCLDDHQFKEEELGVCWRIVKSMLSNSPKMHVFWHALVDQTFYETCTCCHQMDQSLRQTPESFDFLYTLHEWIKAILSCGKHCKTMQIGTVSRLRCCGRSWGFKIHFCRNIVRVWKSYICSNKLDV